MPSTRPAVRWPLERVLFAIAGTITVLSAVLAAALDPWFLVLAGLVGINQLLFVTAGICPMSLLLERAFGLRRCTPN